MSLRILMVNDFYPPFLGGAERQIQLLSHALYQRGHTINVATIWHKELPEQEDDDGVDVRRIKSLATRVPWFSRNPRRRFHPPFPDPGVVWGLRRCIRQFRPDLVHASGWIAYSCAVALSALDIPMVLSARDYGYSCALRTLLHNQCVCSGPTLAKCLACTTPSYGMVKAVAAVAGVFSGRALLRRKVQAMHSVSSFVRYIVQRDLYGVEPAALESGKTDNTSVIISSFLVPEDTGVVPQEFLAYLPDEPYILFVGALQPHKGLDVLLKAYQNLHSPPPLVIIGTVWADTPRSFPPGIVVLHDVPHTSVMAAWERCLFGVAPALWADPSPGVVREAMSQGKAMIAANIGGNLDMIVHGETGLLVPPHDVAALTSAMRQLIDNPALRTRLGTLARSRARMFQADVVVPQFEQLYYQLIQRHQGSCCETKHIQQV